MRIGLPGRIAHRVVTTAIFVAMMTTAVWASQVCLVVVDPKEPPISVGIFEKIRQEMRTNGCAAGDIIWANWPTARSTLPSFPDEALVSQLVATFCDFRSTIRDTRMHGETNLSCVYLGSERPFRVKGK